MTWVIRCRGMNRWTLGFSNPADCLVNWMLCVFCCAGLGTICFESIRVSRKFIRNWVPWCVDVLSACTVIASRVIKCVLWCLRALVPTHGAICDTVVLTIKCDSSLALRLLTQLVRAVTRHQTDSAVTAQDTTCNALVPIHPPFIPSKSMVSWRLWFILCEPNTAGKWSTEYNGRAVCGWVAVCCCCPTWRRPVHPSWVSTITIWLIEWPWFVMDDDCLTVLSWSAYWFHTVTALSMSLSLSVISPSEEEMIFSKVCKSGYRVVLLHFYRVVIDYQILGILAQSAIW